MQQKLSENLSLVLKIVKIAYSEIDQITRNKTVTILAGMDNVSPNQTNFNPKDCSNWPQRTPAFQGATMTAGGKGTSD